MEVCGGVLDLGDVTRDFFDEARADRLSVLCRAADKGQKVRGRAGTRVVNHLSVSLRRALKIDANSDVRVGTRQQGWGYLILMSCRASFSGQGVLACAGDMTGAFPCRCWRSRWGAMFIRKARDDTIQGQTPQRGIHLCNKPVPVYAVQSVRTSVSGVCHRVPTVCYRPSSTVDRIILELPSPALQFDRSRPVFADWLSVAAIRNDVAARSPSRPDSRPTRAGPCPPTH